jgi:hypothetical protein
VEPEAQFLAHFKAVFLVFVFAAGPALFFYLSILAYTHVKARLLVEFYQVIGREVEKQEQLKKTGADAPFLAKYVELHGHLKQILDMQGLLPTPKPKA